jgi:hypothetical protein
VLKIAFLEAVPAPVKKNKWLLALFSFTFFDGQETFGYKPYFGPRFQKQGHLALFR